MPRASFAYLFERFPAFTQTFVVREALEMQRQGMRPLFVSLRQPEGEPPGHFPAEARSNTEYLPEPDALVAEIKRRRAAGELTRAINQRLEAWGSQPDKMRLYEAIFAGHLLKKRKIRHIHAHFAGVAARTAYLIHELYGIGFSWTGHAQDIFCETDFAITLPDLVREARLVVTETDYSAGQLRQQFPAHASKIHRVYNGIDLPVSPSARSPIQPPLILSVGRSIEKKGFNVLIDACAILQKNRLPFSCQIVGDGPLQSTLQQQIDRLNLTESVRLVGPKSQEEIVALSRDATVFALACVRLSDGDSDNFPTVITEAMTQSLPIVSTPVAGIPEQVVEGETGYLVPERDAVSLAGALQKILNAPDAAKEMGLAGFQRARAEFGRETTVRQLRRLLIKYGRVHTPWKLRWS